jgi:transposase-like protein
MSKNACRGHRFPPAVIQLTVWMYARFTLSLRDVEELLAERGLDISYETVRRWFLKFGQAMPAASDMGDIDQRIAGISTRVRHEGAKEEL